MATFSFFPHALDYPAKLTLSTVTQEIQRLAALRNVSRTRKTLRSNFCVRNVSRVRLSVALRTLTAYFILDLPKST